MEQYINNYAKFNISLVYEFKLGNGGIGDYIKFFMNALNICKINNKRLYMKKNNLVIKNYIKLKYDLMNITESEISELRKTQEVKIIHPINYYNSLVGRTGWNPEIKINIDEVFYFTDEVIINSAKLLPTPYPTDYISIHLRLGDKYLETDKNFVLCKKDTRRFLKDNLYKFIEDNYNKNLIFFCDNNKYKLELKKNMIKLL